VQGGKNENNVKLVGGGNANCKKLRDEDAKEKCQYQHCRRQREKGRGRVKQVRVCLPTSKLRRSFLTILASSRIATML